MRGRALLYLAGLVLAAVCVTAPVWSQEAAAPAATPAEGGSTTLTPQEEPPFDWEKAWEGLITKFQAGGATMWVILFLSTMALAFLLERLVRLRRGAFAPTGMAREANRLWQEGDMEGLHQLCRRESQSTLAKIITFILRKRNAPVEQINESIGEIAGRDLAIHQMLTYPMLAVATLAPLLGLFGTVIGMIESFETVAVAGSMGDPTILANGISKALVTTAFGLFVAIPALFFYHIIRLRTRFLNRDLEEQASLLVSEWLLPTTEEPAQAA